MLFKYYGVDWAIFAILVVHLWLLGNKVRAAFLVGILGSSCGIALGYMCDSVAVMIMNSAFICMHFRAWLKWMPLESEYPKIAEDTWPDEL